MDLPDLYEIHTRYEVEERRRDEFGWVDGHGPGNGRYKVDETIYRVVAPSQHYAEAYVRSFSSDGVRNFEIVGVKLQHIDAIVGVQGR